MHFLPLRILSSKWLRGKFALSRHLKKIYFAYVSWVVLLATNSDLYLFFLLRGSLFIKDLCLIYMYGCFAWMWICVPLVCSVNRSQKRSSDTVELELQMAVTYHAGTVNWSPELINSSLSAIFSAQIFISWLLLGTQIQLRIFHSENFVLQKSL